MVKIGIYLPVYGGWLPVKVSAKAQDHEAYSTGEHENPPTYEYVRNTALEAKKLV